MKYRRGLLFWGLALITGGAVALAVQQGYLGRDLLAGAWRLWPLVLVAIGISILVSRTPFAIVGTIVTALVVGTAGGALIAVGPGIAACGGSDPTNLTTRQGTFGDQARVQLEFNCGTLEVAMAEGSDWTVASGHDGGSAAQISADLNHLTVQSHEPGNWFDGGGRQRWLVTLPTRPIYQLEVQPNAADTSLNLRGAHFTTLSLQPNAGSLRLDLGKASVGELDLALNAGSATIIVGEGSDLTGTLNVNAGSVQLCVDGAAAMSFTLEENVAFSHNLDASGLGHDGDTWSYAPPVPSGVVLSFVTLHIQGNAGTFTLNPEGGCA